MTPPTPHWDPEGHCQHPADTAALATQIDQLIEVLTRLAWTLRIDPNEHPIQPDTSEHQ